MANYAVLRYAEDPFRDTLMTAERLKSIGYARTAQEMPVLNCIVHPSALQKRWDTKRSSLTYLKAKAEHHLKRAISCAREKLVEHTGQENATKDRTYQTK